MSDLEKLVPRTDMLAWHYHDPATSTGGNINDKSGNGRHLVQATTPPVIVENAYRERPAWYFDGTKNPVKWTGSIAPKHVFIIASFQETAFTVHRGLLSGVTSGNCLLTHAAGTKLVTFAGNTYRKADVVFSNFWQAPMGSVPQLMELTNPSGISMDGIQIGQHFADTSRKFKGHFFELILYSSVQPEAVREAIAEYAALKYRIWNKVASGLDVWPFQPDWARPLAADKLVLTSLSVSGAIRSRAKSIAKAGIDATFTSRWAEEWDAAQAFWDDKYPGTPFVYRDHGFSPPRDFTLRLTSGLSMQQQSYHDVAYGWKAITDDGSDGTIELNNPAVNFALNAAVLANRTYLESRPEQAVDGVRHTQNRWEPYEPDGGLGGWDSDFHATEPATLTVDFRTDRTFSHIKMFTLRDELHYDDEPTTAETFTLYGITDYRIEYWAGSYEEYEEYVDSLIDDDAVPDGLSQWVTFISVEDNDRVVREHDFLELTARLVRFVALGTADHPTSPHARLCELEVWNRNPLMPTWTPLEVLQKTILENQWPNGLPTEAETSYTANGGPSAAFDLNGDSDLLTFTVFPGLTLNGYVFRPVATPPEGGVVRDAWIICCLGHETVADGIDRVQYLVDRGFKVILLGMPNFEPNGSSWTYTRPDGSTVSITGHAQYETVIEADGHAILPLFLDQIFRAANWIRDQDGADTIIHLTGHSGGGFMTSMAAIVDDKQYFTVRNSNSGELPFWFDDTSDSELHAEQEPDRPWWSGNDWDDLYRIGARFGKFTKTHNEEDDFFQGKYRHHLFRNIVNDTNAALVEKGYDGVFDIYIDMDAVVHDYTEISLGRFVYDCLLYEPSLTALDPTTIAWAAYIADSYTGLSDGDNVGNWDDSTANNRDGTVSGTPQWYGDQLNGHAALRMSNDSTDYFTIPSMAALTEVSSIEISKTVIDASNGGSTFGTDGVNFSHFPYQPTGDIYDDFGSTARKGPITPTVDLEEWNMHYWWSKASDWGLQSNAETAFTTGTNTVGCPSSPVLWKNAFGTPSPQKGYLAARWIFASKLTTDQLFRIRRWIKENYLPDVTLRP